jgi:hypothetical protein
VGTANIIIYFYHYISYKIITVYKFNGSPWGTGIDPHLCPRLPTGEDFFPFTSPRRKNLSYLYFLMKEFPMEYRGSEPIVISKCAWAKRPRAVQGRGRLHRRVAVSSAQSQGHSRRDKGSGGPNDADVDGWRHPRGHRASTNPPIRLRRLSFSSAHLRQRRVTPAWLPSESARLQDLSNPCASNK